MVQIRLVLGHRAIVVAWFLESTHCLGCLYVSACTVLDVDGGLRVVDAARTLVGEFLAEGVGLLVSLCRYFLR